MKGSTSDLLRDNCDEFIYYEDLERLEQDEHQLATHLDADLTYRPESLDYNASTGAAFLNSLVADVRWAASPTTDFALSAVGTIGNDGNVLALLTTIAWRPPL